MNKLLVLHDLLGYAFGATLLAGGLYLGGTKYLEYRKEAHQHVQAWIDKKLTDPENSLPTGGPWADFSNGKSLGDGLVLPAVDWRNIHSNGGNWGPSSQWSPPRSSPPGNRAKPAKKN